MGFQTRPASDDPSLPGRHILLVLKAAVVNWISEVKIKNELAEPQVVMLQTKYYTLSESHKRA